MGEVEARHPERCRRSITNPIVEELKSKNRSSQKITERVHHLTFSFEISYAPKEKIGHVASKRFERGVRLCRPRVWHLSVEHARHHLFQLTRHDHQSLNRFLQINQRRAHDYSQPRTDTRVLETGQWWSINRMLYLLKRMSSCRSTVFIDSEYMTGYFSMTCSMSKFGGSFDTMSAASSRQDCAGDFPPLDDVWRGSVSRILLKSYRATENNK